MSPTTKDDCYESDRMAGNFDPSILPRQRDVSKEKHVKCTDMRDSDNQCDNHRLQYYCSRDIRVQQENQDSICECGWYYPDTSSDMAKYMLRDTSVGTFILRDSLDSRFLFSLSIKTRRGVTSIRISYFKGKFQLDCLEKLKSQLPKFDTTVALVDYYVRSCKSDSKEKNSNRFLESSGRKDMPVLLTKPRVNKVCSLQHLSRQTINRSLPNCLSQDCRRHHANVDKIGVLPGNLVRYLKEYPYLN